MVKCKLCPRQEQLCYTANTASAMFQQLFQTGLFFRLASGCRLCVHDPKYVFIRIGICVGVRDCSLVFILIADNATAHSRSYYRLTQNKVTSSVMNFVRLYFLQ